MFHTTSIFLLLWNYWPQCNTSEVADIFFNARWSHCWSSELTKVLYFLVDKYNQGKSKKCDPPWKRDYQVQRRGQGQLQRGTAKWSFELSFPICNLFFHLFSCLLFYFFSKKKLSYKRWTNNYTRLKNSERRSIKTLETFDKTLTLRRCPEKLAVFLLLLLHRPMFWCLYF